MRLHSIPGLGELCVRLERGFARAIAAIWRVSPESLFDREYYLSTNADVAQSGLDPLFHFLRYGGREGRRPHPSFDSHYYLERYPDVAQAGYNPLLHFLRYGAAEGRRPHPCPGLDQRLQGRPPDEMAMAIDAIGRRIRESGKRVLLAVTHDAGGGVAEHVRKLAGFTRGSAIWLTLKPSPPRSCILECAVPECRFCSLFDLRSDLPLLARAISACGVERIHIHHLMEYDSEALRRLIELLELPFDFTVHDYYTLCPQVTLSDERGRYCEEPGEDGCNRCIQRRPPAGPPSILSWRAAHSWALLQASRVIAPSADAAARIARYYPQVRAIAAEHPGPAGDAAVKPPKLDRDEPLRIAVLGRITVQKGLELLRECAMTSAKRRLPFEFLAIGEVSARRRTGSLPFRQTGSYAPEELAAILEQTAPHLIWFPGRIPETFSYTLSACMEAGLPAAAHDIGSFPERLAERPWSWLLPKTASAADWTDFFLRVRDGHFLPGIAPAPPPRRARARSGFYEDEYLPPQTCADGYGAK